jgi:hypothetical protein
MNRYVPPSRWDSNNFVVFFQVVMTLISLFSPPELSLFSKEKEPCGSNHYHHLGLGKS